MTLAERIRPNSEAAPWVCEEVKALEEENARLRALLAAWRPVVRAAVAPEFKMYDGPMFRAVAALTDEQREEAKR